METLAELASNALVALIAGISTLVFYRVVTGSIRTGGLLEDKAEGGISPARVQLLIATTSAAFFAIGSAGAAVASGSHELTMLPMESLPLLAGSQLFYLGAKYRSHSNRDPERRE